MTNIILCGCGGRMGQAIVRACDASDDLRIVAGVDVNADAVSPACAFPVYTNISEFPGDADVIVDFSHHTALPSLLEYAIRTKTPLVVSTTGHTEDETQKMKEASEHVAIFFSRNMSIGINLMIELAKTAAKTLGVAFDVEIVEKHHNQKLDAPSGTALMIAEAIAEEREESEFVYDRHAIRQKRSPREIGIHSIRGGTIVGEHDAIFAGKDEIVTISHTATSREVFAEGALRAAAYLATKSAGFYNMTDLIHEQV